MSVTQPTREAKVGTNEIAELLGVSPRTIKTYRDQKRIPFCRINARTFRYSVSEVEKALTQK